MLESLIKGGACDCFGVSRAGMLAAVEIVVARAQKKAKDKSSNQVSLLAMAPVAEAPPQPGVGLDCPEATLPEMEDDLKLKAEKEALGFFLTSHPLQPYSREIRRLRLTTLEDARELFPGAELTCAVLVTSVKEVLTKSKGERMAFVGVEDLTGHAEVTFFPRAYAEARELIRAEQPLCLTARLDSQNDEAHDADEENEDAPRELKMLGQSVRPLAEAGADRIVLGCTHYPFLAEAIAAEAGPGIEVIDPAPAIARRVASLLDRYALQADETHRACYTFLSAAGTPYADRLRERASRL